MLVPFYMFLILIDIRLEKRVIKLFPNSLLWRTISTNKMFETLDDVVFSNNNIDSNIVTFFSCDISLNIKDLPNIDFDDYNFDNEDTETIFHVRFLT